MWQQPRNISHLIALGVSQRSSWHPPRRMSLDLRLGPAVLLPTSPQWQTARNAGEPSTHSQHGGMEPAGPALWASDSRRNRLDPPAHHGHTSRDRTSTHSHLDPGVSGATQKSRGHLGGETRRKGGGEEKGHPGYQNSYSGNDSDKVLGGWGLVTGVTLPSADVVSVTHSAHHTGRGPAGQPDKPGLRLGASMGPGLMLSALAPLHESLLSSRNAAGRSMGAQGGSPTAARLSR